MESTRMAFGRRGEDRAAEYIENLGWQVLARNWRCREGEADIVAYDPSADALVVVEVKSRSSTEFGSPLEAITYAKVRTLRHLAAIFARLERPPGLYRNCNAYRGIAMNDCARNGRELAQRIVAS